MYPENDPGWFKRKRIRLDAECYSQDGAICSITIAVQNRRPVFANTAVAKAAVDTLRTLAEETRVPVFAYCIMPDHVHLLIAPSPSCDIIRFVGQYKNLTQRALWKLGVQGAFWQKRFWDHFLRAEEQMETVVEYVLNNPVRRGLVDNSQEYPFSGSLVFEL